MSNKEKKDKRSLMNNIVFTLQHMFKWQPESLWLTLVNSLAVAIAPFIWVVVPKLIIDAVSTNQSTKDIITILLCTLIVASIVYFTKEACIGVYRMKMARTRMLFGLELHGKAMQLDYHHVENVDTQNALHRAKWTTSNPQFGMGGVMQNTFSIVG
jgi:ABC-type multidrug transport system fused ATPase/permease subunit